jgi:hypothetical protein
MAFNPLILRYGNVWFNYDAFTVVVDGETFPADNVPSHISSNYTSGQELEGIFLLMSFALHQEREEEARRAREAERLRALEEQERIIGLAFSMSNIFHRREEAAKKKKKTDNP